MYVAKIATTVGINEKVQAKTMELLKEVKKRNAIIGKDPVGIAAATLYLACVLMDEKKTQRELAEASKVTEVTIRNRYKGLREVLKLKN
ncbi:MAG: hypothetical protein ABIH76_09110 [Candidatus Bathyarchaeota archaeon]